MGNIITDEEEFFDDILNEKQKQAIQKQIAKNKKSQNEHLMFQFEMVKAQRNQLREIINHQNLNIYNKIKHWYDLLNTSGINSKKTVREEMKKILDANQEIIK